MPKPQPNNAQVVSTCTRRLRALSDHVADPSTTLDINGKTYTLAQVRAIYQECLDTRAEIHAQRALLAGLLTKRVKTEALRLAADRALKPWVVNRFGDTSVQAHDFGFPPARVTVMTAEEKLRAVELRAATRKARKTMGKKQKEKIHGTVDGAAGAEE